MSSIKTLFVLALIVGLFAVAVFAQQVAEVKEKSKATLVIGGATAAIRVELSNEDTKSTPPHVTLFEVGKDSAVFVNATVTPSTDDPNKRFELLFPMPADVTKVSYEVVLLVSDSASVRRRVMLPAKPLIVGSLVRPEAVCNLRDEIALQLRSAINFKWDDVLKWVDGRIVNGKRIARLKIAQKGQPDYFMNVFISKRENDPVGTMFGMCLELDKLLPTDKFEASLDLQADDLPADLKHLVLASEFDGAFKSEFKEANKDQVDPGKRKLERALDIAGFFGTSVEDEEVSATESTPATINRRRKNVGILDVDFKAPDVVHDVYEYDAWIHQFSPFFLKASVSTGKITQDTLSQNRVLFGFEGESRYIPETSRLGAIHRFYWGLTHASDRDFKQREIYGSFRYEPIFTSIYKPYDLNYDVVGDVVKSRGYGFFIVPSVGFDLGRTYSRRNPAEAIEETDAVKRLNFGIKLGFDITRRISLTAENIFVLRFEDSEHRERNFFKAGGDFKLFRTNRERMAHSMFATYEKGWQAPFAGQQVNSFRIGYRVVGDFFCGVHCR